MPINRAMHLAEAVARGDLTRHPEVESKDEVGRLLTALGHMVGNLHGIVSSVRKGTDTITHASREVASGNIDLASEVRALAQRSAVAAREIKALIDDSVGQVGTGSKRVGDAGQIIQEVVTSIRRVAELVAEISMSSQEQTEGIQQVGQAITQMDKVTQENASLVEEGTAAAQALEGQAMHLGEVVGAFRLDESLGSLQ